MNKFFYKDLSPAQAYLLTLFFVVLYSFYLFPTYFLTGHAWAFEEYDSALHVANWWLFVNDEWRFPLLKSYQLDDFGGMNLAFTDGIPIAGLFFKSIKSFLPEHFHYFGYWYLLVYGLQVFATTYFFRIFGVKTAFSILIGWVFVLTWPALVQRFGHAALSTQCLLIFAMAVYFAGKKEQIKMKTAVHLLAVFSVLGFLIHPYLFPPLLALFLVMLLERYLLEKSILNIAKYLFVYFLIFSCLVVSLGYLSHDGPRGGGGYGNVFRLDLMTPFCGQGKLWKCNWVQPSVAEWERVNYFGLGLMMLIPFAVYFAKDQFKSFIHRYQFFLVLLVLLTLYAISNVVMVSGVQLFSVKLPSFINSITTPFRVGPRFFWMVGYFVLLMTLIVCLRKKNIWVISVLLVAMLVQVVDLQPINKELKTATHRKSEKNYSQYAALMNHVDKLVGYPAMGCKNSHLIFYTHLHLVAGYFEKKLNSGHQARYNPNCKKHHEKILMGEPQDRHLYISYGVTYGNYPHDVKIKSLPKVFQQLWESGSCAIKSDFMYLMCLKGSDAKFWTQVHPDIYPVVPLKDTRYYYPLEMFNDVGVNANHMRVVNAQDKAGLLAGAPYYNFKPGLYELKIDYSSNSSPQEQIANWSSDLWIVNNVKLKKHFESGKIYGTSGKWSTVSGKFEILEEDTQANFAIRIYNLAGHDINIEKFRIQRMNE